MCNSLGVEIKNVSNKKMVLTLPARGNFCIIARHKRLGGGVGSLLPLWARVGRTF
jgi:hypothetical protein